MASLNKVFLLGTLGKDPELKETGTIEICSFSIATNSISKKEKKTTWHNVKVFGKSALACSKYLAKGSNVFIEGRIENGSYQAKDGTTKYTSEVIANDVQFLNSKPEISNSTDSNAKYVPVLDNDYANEVIPF